MKTAKAPRGRPKGSGIDDQQKLREIARIICSNPRMKPTTAIKAVGITDPSAIRRLRDKFHLAQAELMAPALAPLEPAVRPHAPVMLVSSTSVPAATMAPAPVVAVDAPPTARTVTLKIVEPATPADPFQPIELGHGLTALLSTQAVRSESMPIAVLFLGFGLNAATTLLEQQLQIAQSMMRLPLIQDLVRSQISINAFILSIARPSPGPSPAH